MTYRVLLLLVVSCLAISGCSRFRDLGAELGAGLSTPIIIAGNALSNEAVTPDPDSEFRSVENVLNVLIDPDDPFRAPYLDLGGEYFNGAERTSAAVFAASVPPGTAVFTGNAVTAVSERISVNGSTYPSLVRTEATVTVDFDSFQATTVISEEQSATPGTGVSEDVERKVMPTLSGTAGIDVAAASFLGPLSNGEDIEGEVLGRFYGQDGEFIGLAYKAQGLITSLQGIATVGRGADPVE